MRPPDLDLAAAWQATWDALALPAPADALAALCTAWAAPGRHYHTLQHLQEGLVWFAQVRAMAEQPGEVGLALWFHDAVYDPRAHDNEARSADWAVRVLAAAGAPVATWQRVRALIMATCHAAVPQDPDARLLVDIDLSILGAAPARFAEYDAQIRAEYAWVPAERYRHKRRAVLQGFLQRPVIYTTAALHAALEAQARINLCAALGLVETRA